MSYPGQGYHHGHHPGGGSYGGGYGGSPPQQQYGGGGYGPPPPQAYGGYGPPPGQYYPPPSGGPSNGLGGGFAAGPPQHMFSGGPPMGYGRPEGPVGPSEYQNGPVRYERPTNMTMDNGMHYEYSAMNGKRKALLIGINYVGTSSALRGCWNDVDNMKQFIIQRAGYKPEDMVILSDREQDPRSIPTRANMTAAMQWLVRGAQPGDALFFHYSGHGGQAKATQGDEADGMNETIIPLDYEQVGQMEDDELHELLVRPLPIGCRLTALFDSCHSGTALDLPYVYATSGKIKEPNVFTDVGKGILGAAMEYARGDVMGMAKGLFSTFNTARNTNSAEDITKQTKSSGADVVMLSGCKDSQTSADTVEAHKATGAMSWAFIKVLTTYPQLTYLQLLNCTRDELAAKYSQKPQMSSSHPLDLNLLFVI
ncbi:hypothetical protein K437DRAFT_256096 [Tilletiaria anomala UBC 951]|uniref:Peptidase C14 caspase domain-containing protein n=1 Tax=Tilletiaria anomala (strain ATCC 24038 / CBS 436.72 / UBC 951) TaxID=1037660 RepID=A0A066W6X8_TILAU|nr:uncharacterized protein K437DRAFT_256096 [Tilletiaria anomala UBC 951]KDN46819.1 hypothetical protein K437DRAFT_256096 [Tilletiaria anomala UBC 951]